MWLFVVILGRENLSPIAEYVCSVVFKFSVAWMKNVFDILQMLNLTHLHSEQPKL